MLKSPKDLLAAAKQAAVDKALNEAKVAEEREKLERLRKQFEAECLAAALHRKTQIYFDEAVTKVANLRFFTVEEVQRDQARERFLASKIAEADKQFGSMLESVVIEYPDLTRDIFPNRLAKDFRGLLNRCVNYESAEEFIDWIKRELRLVASFKSEKWGAFEGRCLSLARERMVLEAARAKHAKILQGNSGIPDGLNAALRISWDRAEADFGKAGVLSPSKLKWIAMVWPRWERYFNSDIEIAASDGQTSKEWLFCPANYWGEDDSFCVEVDGGEEPDIDSMSEEERDIYFYWKEIDGRYDKSPRYDEDEGLLIGVHPLPVAEIFDAQGFQVAIEEHGDEDDDDDGSAATRTLSLLDLDNCSVEKYYRLSVSWQKA